MPVNPLQVSSHFCAVELLRSSDSDPVLLRPRRKEPGRVINDHMMATCSPGVSRTWLGAWIRSS